MNTEIIDTKICKYGDCDIIVDYTSDFEDNFVFVYEEDTDHVYDAMFETLENLAKCKGLENQDISGKAYVDDGAPYLYVQNTGAVYPLAVLPVGTSNQYRLCAVAKIY